MAMKNTQAWGWLVAGVLALGLNGFYHDGGAVWAHRAVDRVVGRIADQSGAVLALASGHADRFMVKASVLAARDQTASCRWATAAARLQTKMAPSQSGLARFEAMSAREEAALARVEASRARVEAQVARVRLTPAAFDTVTVPVVCPRVRVNIPRVSIPRPMVKGPVVHVDLGAGPV
jgi:hypothetical protein